MYECVITLGGVDIPARAMTVGQKEFFAAAQQDLKPSYMFRVRAALYNDEDRLIYNGNAYAIYRTYVKGDYIELYTTEKAGVR